MRQRVANTWIRLVGLALAIMAMAPLGMAHPDPHRAPASFDLAAYALPDGSLPELCSAGGHEQPLPDDGSHAACLAACVLVVPAALPVAAIVSTAPSAVHEQAARPATAAVGPRAIWAAAQARAPPTA